MQTYSTISMLPLNRQKVKSENSFDFFCPPAPRSEDGSAGGGWGEECRAVRAWKPRRTARILGGRNRAEIFLSFFEFFSGGAQKKNCKGKFPRGCRRSVSGGGRRGGQFRSKKVRAELYNSTNIKLSDFCPTDSAARSAERYGNTGSPRTARLAKRRFEIPCDFKYLFCLTIKI